jgi:hypothetical protein
MGMDAVLHPMARQVLLSCLAHGGKIENDGAESLPSECRTDRVGTRPPADVEHGPMPGEIDLFRPDKRRGHAVAVHHPGEGARPVRAPLVGLVEVFAAVYLGGIRQHRLFQGVVREDGAVREGVIEEAAEIDGALFEEILFGDRGEEITPLLLPHQPNRQARMEEGQGGAADNLQGGGDLLKRPGAPGEEGKESELMGKEHGLVTVYPQNDVPEGAVVAARSIHSCRSVDAHEILPDKAWVPHSLCLFLILSMVFA